MIKISIIMRYYGNLKYSIIFCDNILLFIFKYLIYQKYIVGVQFTYILFVMLK